MNSNLRNMYQKVNSLPAMTAILPEQLGNGRVIRMRTPRNVSLSSWNMKYFNDTQVEGDVGCDMRLFFCLGEGVEWKTDKEMIRMDTGEAYLCLDDNGHESMCYSGNSDFMFYSISMPRNEFSSIISFYGIDLDDLFSDHNSVHFRISQEIYNLLDRFKLQEYAEDGIDMMRFDALSYEVITLGLKAAKQDYMKPANVFGTEIQVLQHLKNRIDSDPGSVPNTYALAADYGFSVSKLTRLFRELYGSSLHAYVIESRLSEAARLLRERDMAICEVAEHVGYAKPSQFSAAFKKRFGILPSDF